MTIDSACAAGGLILRTDRESSLSNMGIILR